MDAKITKHRLSNFLAYDWLKILAVVVAAIIAMTLIFTMTATNPTDAQTFSVYAYSDLYGTEDFTRLSQTLEDKNVFSYDILKISAENFTDKTYSSMTFSARRSAGEGTVMFTTATQSTEENAPKSTIYLNTYEDTYAGSGRGNYYDPQYFIETEIKNYLADFFGNDLNGAIDEAKVRTRFEERNGKDKRFRKQEQKETGVVQEKARLEKLREDYLAVVEAFEAGKLSYMALDKKTGEKSRVLFGDACPEGSYLAAFDMSQLRSLTSLVYYTVEENDKKKPSAEDVGLLVFHNSEKEDRDLCYETVSFLNYLVGKYA